MPFSITVPTNFSLSKTWARTASAEKVKAMVTVEAAHFTSFDSSVILPSKFVVMATNAMIEKAVTANHCEWRWLLRASFIVVSSLIVVFWLL